MATSGAGACTAAQRCRPKRTEHRPLPSGLVLGSDPHTCARATCSHLTCTLACHKLLHISKIIKPGCVWLLVVALQWTGGAPPLLKSTALFIYDVTHILVLSRV